MVFRIVVAGESQCDMFAKTCIVADYLTQNLPDFCYERIEKSVLEWKPWLSKVNQKNNWHHIESPLVWKELLMSGSKPFYIGGATDFQEYCYSYYKFDAFMAAERFQKLTENCVQFNKKAKIEENISFEFEENRKTNFTVCITGAGHPLSMYLISNILELSLGKISLSKIFIYDKECPKSFMELVEKECSYIGTNHSGKIVKYVEKVGLALTNTDVLIIMDHVPFQTQLSIGDWLYMNKKLMENIATTINTTAALRMRVIIPNLGPACYNATVLSNNLTNIIKKNIVVATSNLGMAIASTMSEVTEIPLRNIYCPPIWGFVGINHLVDIKTTIYRYDSFKPYDRFAKVKNSSLCIGTLTPEMRTMEHLLYFEENFWKTIGEKKKRRHNKTMINIALAVANIVEIWLVDPSPDYIVNLGIKCDGSFGLTFEGFFSQPSKLVNGKWLPAHNFLRPKDNQMNIYYLQEIARIAMNLDQKALPPVIKYTPCTCKRENFKKKGVW